MEPVLPIKKSFPLPCLNSKQNICILCQRLNPHFVTDRAVWWCSI